MSRRYSRRAFLRRTASAGLALPLLGSLPGQLARAAGEASFPKRFVVFFTPNGTNPDTWFPTPGVGESDFALTDLHGPLVPFKDRLLFLRGVHMKSVDVGPGEPHQQGMGGILTGSHLQEGSFVGGDGSLAGWGNGISVDQRIANAWAGSTPRKSLELGVRVNGSEVRHRLSYSGPAQPLPPMTDPADAFTQLFGGFTVEPSEAAAIRDRRKSVIDAAQAQMAHVRHRVSVAYRLKLDAHLQHLRQLEVQVLTQTVLGESCAIPAPPPALDANSEDEMGQVAPLMIQQLVMSLACDITRVATLQMSSGANNIRFPFLYSYADDHVLSHAGPSDATSIAEWSLRQHWYSSQFAYLLGLMDAIPEGSGSLLDNSLVLWCSELGRGSTHSHNDIPFILAGGAGGTVAPGRYLQFADRNHNDLLVAILNAMGVAATSFGDPDYSVDGALAGILS